MEWFEWVTLGLAATLLIVAAALVMFSRRSPATLFLSLFLAAWGILAATDILLIRVFAAPPDLMRRIYFGVFFVHNAALLAFALTYPNLVVTRLRIALIAALAAGTVLFLGALAATAGDPAAMAVLLDIHWAATWGVMVAGLAVLGLRWIQGKSEAYRVQVLWGLLVFFFWIMHDGGTSFVYATAIHGAAAWMSGWFDTPLQTIGNLSFLAAVIAAIGLALYATFRHISKRGDASDRAFALLAPFLVAATTVQVFVGGVHVPIDFIASALVIYGVIRFHIVDLDIRLKRNLGRGFVAGGLVAVFFVASELARLLIESLAGSAVVGIMAVGVLLLFVAPMHRGADAIAQRAMPHVSDDEAYRNYRRFQIYRVALEGALQDGSMDAAETKSLANLRAHLGLSLEDHRALEDEIRATLSPRAAPPDPAS